MGALWQIPEEGWLFPASYKLIHGETRTHCVQRMHKKMQSVVKKLWSSHHPVQSILQTPRHLVTLASIIEKETGYASERSHIAAVFYNRLRKNMPLQSDPTVIYALTQGNGPLQRLLTRYDTKTPSAMNTYVTKGLPPQAIACPGEHALKAALTPITTDDLYFVSNGKGGHRFSRSLNEHLLHTRTLRHYMKEKNAS